jgi:Tol biopolymer transport system component
LSAPAWPTGELRRAPTTARRAGTFVALALLAVLMQGCLGLSKGNTPVNSGNFKQTSTGHGPAIGINNTDQAIFSGKIYFILDQNLYYLDGNRQLHQLTRNMDIRDPAVSPNGKWIAFISFHPDYSDLAYMPATGGPITILMTGAGQFIPNPPYPAPQSTHHWFSDPAWSADSTHLLFLSDLQKATWSAATLGVNAFLLDLQVFSVAINDPNPIQDAQIVAYAAYGAGGDSDPSYRPGHPDQVIYTHYAYDSTQTKVITQLFLEDPNAIVNNPGKGYHPGVFDFDPAVALTPPGTDVANFEPAFSPDGNFIAYVRTIDATHMGLYIMPVAEGVTSDPNNPAIEQKALLPYQQSSLIVESLYVSQPVWSPDGKEIAYITYSNSTFDIWLLTVTKDPKSGAYMMKGSPVQLTDAGGHLTADSRLFWTA